MEREGFFVALWYLACMGDSHLSDSEDQAAMKDKDLLQWILEEGNKHVRDVDNRRDRVVGTYVALTVLAVGVLKFLGSNGSQGAAELGLMAGVVLGAVWLVGFPVGATLCEFRAWHTAYNLTVKVAASIAFRRRTLSSCIVQDMWRHHSEFDSGEPAWGRGSERTLFWSFLCVHSLVGAFAFSLCIPREDGWGGWLVVVAYCTLLAVEWGIGIGYLQKKDPRSISRAWLFHGVLR